MKTFRYKKIRTNNKLPSIKVLPPVEQVPTGGGTINGLKATIGEVNSLNAAMASGNVDNYAFRMAVGAPKYMPGWKELDFLFLMKSGEYVAVQIRDHDFVHKGEAGKSADESIDAFTLQALRKDGIIVRGNQVYTIDDNEVDTPERAKRALEAIL